MLELGICPWYSTLVRRESINSRPVTSRSKENTDIDDLQKESPISKTRIFPGEIYEDDENEDTSIYERAIANSNIQMEMEIEGYIGASRMKNRVEHSNSVKNNYGNSTLEEMKRNFPDSFIDPDNSKIHAGNRSDKTDDKIPIEPSISVNGMSRVLNNEGNFPSNSVGNSSKAYSTNSGIILK